MNLSTKSLHVGAVCVCLSADLAHTDYPDSSEKDEIDLKIYVFDKYLYSFLRMAISPVHSVIYCPISVLSTHDTSVFMALSNLKHNMLCAFADMQL